MAYTGQVHHLPIQTHSHKHPQVPHVNKEETAKACIFTANVSGYKVEDVQVQVEDEEALILRFSNTAQKFTLPAHACLDEISANWKEGVLTITIPKM